MDGLSLFGTEAILGLSYIVVEENYSIPENKLL